MKMYALGALMAILTACSTTGNTQTPFTLKDGYVAKFTVGDCAKISPKSSYFKRSDGTPVKIIYVDKKYVGYVLYVDHPRLNGPSVFGDGIKRFDKHWILTECPK